MASTSFPPFVVTFLYPRTEGTTFNLAYYTSSHVPLAEKIWSSYGPKFRSITPLDEASGYHLSSMAEWPSEEAFSQALSDPRTKELNEDVASGNFTNSTPIILPGKNTLAAKELPMKFNEDTMDGQCMCENIKVTIKSEALEGAHSAFCHCKNCRTQSGATGSYIMFVEDKNLKVEGQPTFYLDEKTSSGVPLKRWFCKECGSPIMSTSPIAPGHTAVKLGLFEKIPSPSVENFTRNRQAWEPAITGAKQNSGA